MIKQPIKLKTWEEVRSLDDCVNEGEARIIRDVLRETRPENLCPYLQREGEVFVYCGARVPPKERSDNELGPFNPKYRGFVGSAVLQLFCVGGRARHEVCIDYRSYQRKEAASTSETS